jgi:hypothetical protein
MLDKTRRISHIFRDKFFREEELQWWMRCWIVTRGSLAGGYESNGSKDPMAGFNSPAGPSSNVGVTLPFLVIKEVPSTAGVLFPEVAEYDAYAFGKLVRGSFA